MIIILAPFHVTSFNQSSDNRCNNCLMAGTLVFRSPYIPPVQTQHLERRRTPYPVTYNGRCEDWVFLVKVALSGAEFGSINRELCTYRLGCSNFTADAENSCAAAIEAAIFISTLLPETLRNTFVSSVCHRTLRRYLELQKPRILADSVSWRIGHFLTAPLTALIRLLSSLRRKQTRTTPAADSPATFRR
ncbi:MAG UNVERIFIED_CONTAM: hypothetical protein LVR18_21800 [Planctomycetaceae bacterium]